MMNTDFQIEIPDRYIGKNKDIDPEVVVRSLFSTTLDWDGFERHLKSGQPYSFNNVDLKNGHRRAEGFLSASQIEMDSDKNATLAEILNPANPLAKHIGYIAPSPSDTETYRKFRVIFPLVQPIFDRSVLTSTLHLLYNEFLRFGVCFDPACVDVVRWYYARETDEIFNFDLNPLAVPSSDYLGILRLPSCQPLDFSTLADFAGEIEHRHATPTIQIMKCPAKGTDLDTIANLLEDELRQAGVLLERQDAVNDKVFCSLKLTHCHTSDEHAKKDHNRGAYSHANLTLWNDGGLTYHCYGGQCSRKSIRHFLRNFRIQNKTLATALQGSTQKSNYTPQLLVPDRYPHHSVVNERYLSKAISIQETKARLVILDSALGTGKTECLKNGVKFYRQQGLTVLTVIPRQTLGTQASLRFDVVNYQGETQDEMTIVRSRTVCIPSLNKLIDEGDIPEYDVLLIDEPSNVLKFFTSQGQGLFNPESPSTHALECAKVLIEIGRKAKKIVIAESCMDQRVAWIFRRMFDVSLDDVLVIKNRFQENLPVTLWGITDSIRNSEIYTELEQVFAAIGRPWETQNRFRDWMKQAMLKEAVIAGSDANIPLIIACDEKENGAHGIRRLLIEHHRFSPDEILTITSETKDSPDVHAFLQDPNTFIQSQQPRAIIHTAAMETGFSIEEKCGVVSVADSRNHTLDASTSLQMIGRCRKPAFIHCLLDERFRFESTDSSERIEALITNHKYLEAKHKLNNQRMSDYQAWVNEIHGQLTAESNRQRMRLIESVPAFLEANGYDLKWIDPEAMIETFGCNFGGLVGDDSLLTARAIRNERITRQHAIIESVAISPEVASQHRKKKTLSEALIAGEKKGEILSLSGAQWVAESDGKIKDTLLLKPENAGLLKFVEKSSFDSEGKPVVVPTNWEIEKLETHGVDWARLQKTKEFIVESEFINARADIFDEELFGELFVNNAVKKLKLHKTRNRRRFEAFYDFHAESETLVDWDVAEVNGATPIRAFKDPRRQIADYVKRVIERIGEKSVHGAVWVREWDQNRIDALDLDLKPGSVLNIDKYIQKQFDKDASVERFTISELVRSHFKSTGRMMDRGDYLGACRAILNEYFYAVRTEYNQPASDEKLLRLVPGMSQKYEVKRVAETVAVVLDTLDCMDNLKRTRMQAFLSEESAEPENGCPDFGTVEKCLSFLNGLKPDGNPLGLMWFATSDEKHIVGVPCRVYRSVGIDTELEDVLLALKDTPTSETAASLNEMQDLKDRIKEAADAQAALSDRKDALDSVEAIVMDADRPVSIRELAEELKLDFDDRNRMAINRKLNTFMKDGKIGKTGAGKNTVYFGIDRVGNAVKLGCDSLDSETVKNAITSQPQSISEIAAALGLDISTNATRLRLKRRLRELIDENKVHTTGIGNHTRYFVGSFRTKRPFCNKEDLIQNDNFVQDDPTENQAIFEMPVSGSAVTTMPVETECGLVYDKLTTHHGRKTKDIWYVVNDEKIDDALGWIGNSEIIGLDFETYADCDINDPLYVHKAHPRLLSVSDGTRTTVFDCASLTLLSKKMREWLATKTVVCHNAQFDLVFLARWDIKPKRVIDTMILESVILGAEGSKGTKTLKVLCEKYLDVRLDKTNQIADWTPDIPLSDEMILYSANDAKVLVPLKDELHAKILELGMDEQAYEVFCNAIPAFVEAKRVGMPIDIEKTQGLYDRLKADALRIESGLVLDYGRYGYTTANSSTKIARVIHQAFRVEVRDTSRETLAQLVLDTESDALKTFCEQVLSVRRLLKIATELDKYIKLAVDGRIHANYRLSGAISGRTTGSNPNLQQVSKGAAVEGLLETGEIRSCFVAPEGYRLVVGDYSQIELVLNAVHCGDAEMLSAFRNGVDIHSHTSSKIFGKPIGEVSKDERQIGKSANFGLQYGMGTEGFQNYAKSYGVRLSLEEARQIRQAWFESYKSIAIHYSQVRSQKPERVHTIAGRCIHPKGFTDALNLPIQGSGADLLNRAVAIIHDRLSPFDASIVTFVHDELVVLAKEEEVEEVAEVVERGMAEAGKDFYAGYEDLIRSEVKIGQDWAV